MTHQIILQRKPEMGEPHGDSIKKDIERFLGIEGVERVTKSNVVLVDAEVPDIERVRGALTDEVIQQSTVGTQIPNLDADWHIHVPFQKGVTDNQGRTAKGVVLSSLFPDRQFTDDEAVYTSNLYGIHGNLTRAQVDTIGKGLLANELIQDVFVYSREEIQKGFTPTVPKITDPHVGGRIEVDMLNASDDELVRISREGILSLSLEEMQTIKDRFKSRGRKPSQSELEMLAQTWSEHCKHKIFNALIDYSEVEDGKVVHQETIDSLFKTYIEKATTDTEKDWLLSVFKDNAGVLSFNDRLNLVYKVETHNSPSALDPYGGAMTGIVGVNRDPFGTGRGAALLVNVWGYCLGSPFLDMSLIPKEMMHTKRIRDGVHGGIIDGGNQSGLPYGVGWEYFDDRFRGKPLIYCGTAALQPKTVAGMLAHEKEVDPGDFIVMVGGRIGKDGIHGATFSSEELHTDSPLQAVQIGDPITQKKMTDFLLEARDRGFYRGITDNGAGGLSSSVGEMATFSNGADMDLTKAPVKYAGLEPWEILVSEAQERMTLGIIPEHLESFLALAKKRDVEATVLGTFNDSGRFTVTYNEENVVDLDMDFLHHGLSQKKLRAVWEQPVWDEPKEEELPTDMNATLIKMLGRLNICSIEEKARQYDHEVKGRSVVKPFVGANADARSPGTVFLAEYDGVEGIAFGSAVNPGLSDIDTYWMTATVIDEAIRRMICVGADFSRMACLDNFCWPDPEQSEKTPDGEYKLAQLVRANKALYKFATEFGIPPISGKDSMKNDCTKGVEKKISVPPTLLLSGIAKVQDVRKTVTMDSKQAGDLVVVFGTTYTEEVGGSEYLKQVGEDARGEAYIGNNCPRVFTERAKPLYDAIVEGVSREIFHSLHTPTKGGLGVTLAEIAFGGGLGIEVNLDRIKRFGDDLGGLLFGESNSRLVATVSPDKMMELQKTMREYNVDRYSVVGVVTDGSAITMTSKGEDVINLDRNKAKQVWQEPLRGV